MKDKEFLEKYNEIFEKFSNIIKKILFSELIYNKKYLTAEKKSYKKNQHKRMLSMYLYISDID